MTSTFHTKAITLSREPFRESDLRVVVYSSDLGRMSLIARGGLKPGSKLAGHVEPFILSDLMVIRGRGGNYLASSIGRNFFIGIKSDLTKLGCAGTVARIIKKETREGFCEEARDIFQLLSTFLAKLEQFKKQNQEMLSLSFLLKFLKLSGSEPSLDVCLHCQSPLGLSGNYFSPGAGGVVCPDCQDAGVGFKFVLSGNSIKILRFLQREDLGMAGKLVVEDESLNKEVIKTVKAFYNYNFSF